MLGNVPLQKDLFQELEVTLCAILSVFHHLVPLSSQLPVAVRAVEMIAKESGLGILFVRFHCDNLSEKRD